ncbi:MAG: hypothetical protein JOS17DRAFT_792728 [Linnemannia elongata]|nr:MAG: hypothetical protein JOS17DRAFT_792728 [Linnemannia elongata]
MPETLSVPPSPGLASVPTTPISASTNNSNSKNNSRPRRQDSSTTMTHLSPTFPPHNHAQALTTAVTTTAQPSASPSSSSTHSSSTSHSSHTSTALTTGATAGERRSETESAVAVRMDASPIILFTLQYSVAVVQGVTIYILSVVFSILQLVSGQLNDPPSSGSTNSGSGARKKVVGSGDEGLQQRRQQRRRRWSGSGSGTTSPTSTSGVSWAQNLIAHTQQTQAQSQSIAAETHIIAPTGGTEAGGGGTLAQRVEVLRFLGSTIANLVGSYARPTTSSSAFSSTREDNESVPQKRHLASSMSTGTGGTGPGGQGGVEMSYSSKIRRALVRTLSGHAIPLPRSMKRVTFNDALQFHTTTTNRRPRAHFGVEDDEEDEDEDEDEESSPVLRFFSGGFGAGVTLSREEPMSTSPTPSVPLLVPGGGKKVKKNRPPSIMPSARDRRQLQEQDDLEDMTAAVQETGSRSSGFSVVSNGRSIPVSTTTMTPEVSTTTGKKLVSTITMSLPPISRPRKQQHQPQTPTSPAMTIAATSTTTASGSATTTTTTTSMTPTSYSPMNGTSGLASALLSSLMMPASSGPISDVARSLLSPTTLEASAAVISDSDSSKSTSGGRSRGTLKRTRSAPSKITTFLQQHRLARQQQQQQGRSQMQGLFSSRESTSPRDVSSPLPSATAVVAKANVATETESTTPSSSTAPGDSATATSMTAAPTVRARQPSTSSTTTLIRPRSLYSIQSTVSSAVAAVIGGEPPPSVPLSLTTSMSRSLSPRLEPTTFSPTAVAFSPTHQRKRSASVDLTNVPSLRLPSSSSTEAISTTPGPGTALEPATSTSSSSGGRSLMYKLTHPQRYKRELELQLQSQHQRDTSSLSSATSSPSASQVALTPLSPTGSPTSIQETAPASATATTKMMYPFSRSFTDLPASLSYLSDDPHPAHLPPPHTYSSVSVQPPSPPTSASVATTEIHHPLPLPLTPPPSDKDTVLAALKESTTPPLSMFFPSPTTQHRVLASLPSPALSSSSSSPTMTSATAMLSSMKDSQAQLRRSPSPRPRSMDEDEDEDGTSAHTTFAACGFSLASPSNSSSSS